MSSAVPPTRTVLFLHGLGGSPRSWSRVEPLLGDTYRTVALHIRGNGSIEDDARTVARELHARGCATATVVAHSRGGLVATALAQQFPALVERLILVSTPPTFASRLTARGGSERLLRIPLLGSIVWSALPSSALRRGLASAFAPGHTIPQFAVDDLLRTGRQRLVADGDGTDHFLTASNLNERLSSVRCRIDVVYGLEDQRVSPAAMASCGAAAGRTAFPIADEGHGVPWTSAGAVAAVILDEATPRAPVTPTVRPVPTLRPRRWTPPPLPDRARRSESDTPMGTLHRVELPGRGPEDVRVDSKGRILTGIEDGRILRVTLRSNGSARVETVADTSGRPLGIAVIDDRMLLVCDSERGLLRVNIESGQVTVLAAEVDGDPLNFASNVVHMPSGRVYFTASTRRFGFQDYLGDLLEHSGTGRLLALEPDGRVRTLADGIQFANGLAVSDDENTIIVSETGSFRLEKYRRVGDALRADTALIDNLPGFPDNISVDGDLIWISLANPRDPLFDRAARLPGVVRKLAFRLPEKFTAGTNTTWIMAVDNDGRVVHDLQSSTPDYSMVTSVVRAGSRLVLGSITESALAVIRLPGVS